MLPILRIIPVGGVLLAILILLLALTPPGAARRALPDVVFEARGPLIDRGEHPEWRQFLIRAALQRADELQRLRDLPDTPVVHAPEPRRAPIEIVIPLQPPVTHTEASVPRTEEVAPAKPPTQETSQADVPAAKNTAAAEPVFIEPAAGEAAPAINAEDAPKVIAALPSDRTDGDPDNEDVTGSINDAPGATIPVDIGETSSTELPVAAPEEKPPVIRAPEHIKPPRDSRNKSGQRTRHAKSGSKRAKVASKGTPKPKTVAQRTLFEVLFGPFRPEQQAAVVNTLGGAGAALPPNQINTAAN
jgi:hypothetical protein